MKYLAFESAVAMMALRFIENTAIASGVKIAVEMKSTNAVELTSTADEMTLTFLEPILEKFNGRLTDELPSPVIFLNKLPRTRRPQGNEYDFTTRGERERKYDGRGRCDRNASIGVAVA